MTRLHPFLAALGVLLAAEPALAQSVTFRHTASLYADAKDVAFKNPEGVACSDGQLAVSDTGNGRIVLFPTTGASIGLGTALKVPQVTHPTRLQFDGKGNLLVLDRKSRRIVRLDPKGAFLGYVEFRSAGGTLAVSPVAFKLDASDNVHVIDIASGAVVVVDGSGTVLRQIPLPAGRNTAFTDLCADASGTVYAVDAVGAVVWSAPKGATAFKPLTKGLKENVSFPTTITTDNKGRLFLVDQNGAGIVVVGLDGSYQGRQLSMGWSEGLLYYPTQLCFDAKGEAFVADRSNQRVQVFATSK